MEILPSAYYDSVRRYWRRRKYQRLNGATHNKKELKISRLGRASTTQKFHSKNTVSPIEFLAKFHDAYIDMMICLANKIANPNNINGGLFRGKKVAKSQRASLVVSSGEEVDSSLVMEIYKRLAASRQDSSTEL